MPILMIGPLPALGLSTFHRESVDPTGAPSRTILTSVWSSSTPIIPALIARRPPLVHRAALMLLLPLPAEVVAAAAAARLARPADEAVAAAVSMRSPIGCRAAQL